MGTGTAESATEISGQGGGSSDHRAGKEIVEDVPPSPRTMDDPLTTATVISPSAEEVTMGLSTEASSGAEGVGLKYTKREHVKLWKAKGKCCSYTFVFLTYLYTLDMTRNLGVIFPTEDFFDFFSTTTSGRGSS